MEKDSSIATFSQYPEHEMIMASFTSQLTSLKRALESKLSMVIGGKRSSSAATLQLKDSLRSTDIRMRRTKSR
jgi:hypothetical protein